ncbi:hypothetical protein SPRG_09386 [Saprolegnia parasitica CBS 223.65]|uniref:Glycine transporter domain-containing protein n=1 Tax=Saprolegnia parasitica (strain CBS 223.65) TaxID=695850 RepID=A0A067C3S4_SAPPC|nr:hypothetical protein SPRG_09386 [Saprolegnia parasitica CBS 223.65]KDO25444.1 hypothetical protein SPRG_09386 [Saprolegnia parasitica CBS 223.65]|eukprot:XP_012203870.1 hypothetical protein SPRG_09386 [Saprolegnia parasitica CBS 223.65]
MTTTITRFLLSRRSSAACRPASLRGLDLFAPPRLFSSSRKMPPQQSSLLSPLPMHHTIISTPPLSATLKSPTETCHIDIGTPSLLAATTEVKPLPREGLPRWPGLRTPTGFLRSLDWFGTIVFATSGSLTAAMCGADLLGSIIIGTITAVGGGTLRDALVLNKQPFWVEEWEYLVMSALAATTAFYFWGDMRPGQEIVPGSGLTLKSADGGEGTAMEWGDAVGVGAFAVIGAMNGIRASSPMLVSALCGMMTSTFGGLTRDTLLGRPVRILHSYSDVYATVAFSSACLYLALRKAAPRYQGCRIFAAICLAVFLREQAWTHGWRLPFWAANSQRVMMTSSDPRANGTSRA